jgi:hypothetical protein
MKWALFLCVSTGGYQSGAGITSKIVYGYPNVAAAEDAARSLRDAGVKAVVFPYYEREGEGEQDNDRANFGNSAE